MWNEKTGNVVSGHQRIAILDALEGTDNFLLDVDVVKLSPKAEREENLFFNNTEVQGMYDPDKLGAMLADDTCPINLEQTGFEKMSVEVLLADTDYADLYSAPIAPEVQGGVDELAGMAEARRAENAALGAANGTLENGEAIRDPEAHARIKAEREKSRAKMQAGVGNDDTEFFVIVTCADRTQRERLNLELGRPADSRYVSGAELLVKLGVDLDTPAEDA